MTSAERALLVAIGRNVYQESMALPTVGARPRTELIAALVAVEREAAMSKSAGVATTRVRPVVKP